MSSSLLLKMRSSLCSRVFVILLTFLVFLLVMYQSGFYQAFRPHQGNYDQLSFTQSEAPEGFFDDDFVNNTQKWIFGSFLLNNSHFCSNDNKLQVLILIHSAVANSHNRQVFRKYVPSNYYKLVFLVGQSSSSTFNELIYEEAKKYKDIVQGSFIDSYRNLTLKHIMGLTWALKFCSEAQFLLKMDDDIFVNLPTFKRYLDQEFPSVSTDALVRRANHKFIACYVQRHMKVLRNESNKWFVSQREYADEYFPDFCSGWAYLTTPEVANDLLNQVQNSLPALWIDDAYVTGVLRQKTEGIELSAINQHFNLNPSYLKEWTLKFNRAYNWRYMFSNTNGEAHLMERAFKSNTFCQNKKSECSCCYPHTKDVQNVKLVQPKSEMGEVRKLKIAH